MMPTWKHLSLMWKRTADVETPEVEVATYDADMETPEPEVETYG